MSVQKNTIMVLYRLFYELRIEWLCMPMFIFFQKSRKMVNSITHRIYICCYQYGNYIRTVFDNQCLNPIILFSDKYRLVHKTKCQVTLRVFKNIGSIPNYILGFFVKTWWFYVTIATSWNPTIYSIIRWFAGPMEQTTHWPSVWWRSKYFFSYFLQT